jgi:hypothetical protein
MSGDLTVAESERAFFSLARHALICRPGTCSGCLRRVSKAIQAWRQGMARKTGALNRQPRRS